MHYPNMLTGILIILFILCALLYIKRKYFNNKAQIPGPRNLPLLGVIPFLGSKTYVKFTEWGQEYGPVFQVKIGLKTVIILNSYEAITEAFVKKGKFFNHRSPESLLRLEMKGMGLLNNEGNSWMIHRRFTTQCLKDLGFGRAAIEGHILDELVELISDLQSISQPFDPRNLLTTTVANIIWTIVAGHRFQKNDEKLLDLANKNDAVIKSLGTMGILNFYPQLRFFFRKKYAIFKYAMDDLKEFLQMEINVHRQLQFASPNDLISGYLNAGSVLNSEDEQIRAVLLDLFIAGLETSVTIFRWAMLLLLKYPEVQRKLQAEIDEVITDDVILSTEYKSQMPYTQAFIAETLRFTCVIPMVHHCTANDTTIFGYDVSASTPVIGNIWSIHRSPKLWTNPNDFDVSRFLDENKNFKKINHFLPFGIGKRTCPGENLAKAEFFLFIVCLLKKFSLLPVPGSNLSLEPECGLVMSPKKFNLYIEKRNDAKL